MSNVEESDSGYAGSDGADPSYALEPQTAIVAAGGAIGRSSTALGVSRPVDPFADGAESPGATRSGLPGGTFSIGGLLRFKGTMLVAFVAVAGTALTAVWGLIVPEYRAKATIEIPPGSPRVLYRTEDNNIPYHTQYFNSQPSLIRGPVVLNRVLEKPTVQQTSWYHAPKKTLLGGARSQFEALREALAADPRPGTYLIDISMGARDPHDAQVIVNEVVDEYLAFARDKARESDDTSRSSWSHGRNWRAPSNGARR
jgi:hypothetical protein